MNYSKKEWMRSPGYKNASAAERAKLLPVVEEFEAGAQTTGRPANYSGSCHEFKCEGCGKKVRRGWTAIRCEDCQRQHKAELQQNSRRLESTLYRTVETEFFVIHEPIQIPCEHCGKLFQPQRTTARFCCGKCRVYWHRANKQVVID